jgi:hypothetical protein
VHQRSILFFASIAAAIAGSSPAAAGWAGWGAGCGWCGGCGPALYAPGLAACDARPIYVVNQGPVYSGPAIMTYPTYTPRCGFGGCYGGFFHPRPVVDYGYRYHHRHYVDYDRVRPRHYHDHYTVRRSVPRVKRYYEPLPK